MRQLVDTPSNLIATPGFTGPEKHVGRIGERDGMDCRNDGERARNSVVKTRAERVSGDKRAFGWNGIGTSI